jgi:hypothetical protein
MKVTSVHHRQTGHSKGDTTETQSTGFGGATFPINSVPAVGSPDPDRTRQPLRGNPALSTTNEPFRRSK